MTTGYITSTINSDNFLSTTDWRYNDKSWTSVERDYLFKDWWTEQIKQYGVEINYYISNFSLTASDLFYGEEMTRGFMPAQNLIVAPILNDDSLTFTHFGMMSDDEVEFYIDIYTFQNTLSTFYGYLSASEPRPGDLIELSEYGNDRPGGRSGKLFEITERLDQSIKDINQLQGHYVFKCRAKRYNYNYVHNTPSEANHSQVIDDTNVGQLTASDQSYANDIDAIQQEYFDYGSNDDVYGGY
jgi:hypothetical protein